MKVLYKGVITNSKTNIDNTIYLELENNKFTNLITNETYKADYVGRPITPENISILDLKVITREQLIKELQGIKSKAYVIVKPDGVVNLGGILEMITNTGLKVTKVQGHIFTVKEAQERYAHLIDNPDYSKIIENIISEESYIIEVQGENALKKLNAIKGPKNPKSSKNETYNTIRGLFGSTITCNAVEIAKDSKEETKIINILKKK